MVCGSGHSPPTLLTLISLLLSPYIYCRAHRAHPPLCIPHRSLISDIFLKDSSYNYRPHRHITAVIPDSFQVTLRCTPPLKTYSSHRITDTVGTFEGVCPLTQDQAFSASPTSSAHCKPTSSDHRIYAYHRLRRHTYTQQPQYVFGH